MHDIDEQAVLRRRCATFRIHQHRDAEQPSVLNGHPVRRQIPPQDEGRHEGRVAPVCDHRTTHEIMNVLDDYPAIEAPMTSHGRTVQQHRPKRRLRIECRCPIPSRRIQRLRLIRKRLRDHLRQHELEPVQRREPFHGLRVRYQLPRGTFPPFRGFASGGVRETYDYVPGASIERGVGQGGDLAVLAGESTLAPERSSPCPDRIAVLHAPGDVQRGCPFLARPSEAR